MQYIWVAGYKKHVNPFTYGGKKVAEEIIIEIDENGDLSADVAQGPGGAQCEKELDKLLSGLGKTTKNKRKPEFFTQVKNRRKTKA